MFVVQLIEWSKWLCGNVLRATGADALLDG